MQKMHTVHYIQGVKMSGEKKEKQVGVKIEASEEKPHHEFILPSIPTGHGGKITTKNYFDEGFFPGVF